MARQNKNTTPSQAVFDALNSPVRREILWLLSERELPAGMIAGHFSFAAPTISQHLAILRDAGLVIVRAEKNHRYYSLDQEAQRSLRLLMPGDDRKWFAGISEATFAKGGTVGTAVVELDLPCDQQHAFHAFTNAAAYSAWLGVPVARLRMRGRATVTQAPWDRLAVRASGRRRRGR